MFPQEVDVINIALILPVFSAAVVKTTPVWVLCVLGNSRGGGWLDGGGQRYACECVCMPVHVRRLHEDDSDGIRCTTPVG